jgi:hypothetical protein
MTTVSSAHLPKIFVIPRPQANTMCSCRITATKDMDVMLIYACHVTSQLQVPVFAPVGEERPDYREVV